MLTFDVQTDCNDDIAIQVFVPNISRERSIAVDCGQIMVAQLHLSVDEAKDLVHKLIDESEMDLLGSEEGA